MISPMGIDPTMLPYGNGGFLQGKGNPGNSFLQSPSNAYAAPPGQMVAPRFISSTGIGSPGAGATNSGQPIMGAAVADPFNQGMQPAAVDSSTPSGGGLTEILSALARSITSMQAAGSQTYKPKVTVTENSASVSSTTNPNIGLK